VTTLHQWSYTKRVWFSFPEQVCGWKDHRHKDS
jgi:hypothetical protein